MLIGAAHPSPLQPQLHNHSVPPNISTKPIRYKLTDLGELSRRKLRTVAEGADTLIYPPRNDLDYFRWLTATHAAARSWKVDGRLWNSRFVGKNLEADRDAGREVVRNAARVEWDAWVWGTDDDGGKYGLLLVLDTSW